MENNIVPKAARRNRSTFHLPPGLTVPVLAVGGEISNSGPPLEEMMGEVADHVTALRVPATSRWIAEENPKALSTARLEFVQS